MECVTIDGSFLRVVISDTRPMCRSWMLYGGLSVVCVVRLGTYMRELYYKNHLSLDCWLGIDIIYRVGI